MSILVIVHTLISLVAIVFGVGAVAALVRTGVAAWWTELFLVLAVATTATGFLLPFAGITPAVATGIVATIILAAVLAGRYLFGLRGLWRGVYAGGIVASLYLLVFVGIAQAFQKLAPLHALAPTGSEPAFAIAQGVGLAIFLAVGVYAVRGFAAMSRRAVPARGGPVPPLTSA